VLKPQAMVPFPHRQATSPTGHKPVPNIKWHLVIPAGILFWAFICGAGWVSWQIGTYAYHWALNAFYEISQIPLSRYH